VAGISPAIETFTVDVTCEPGKDVGAQVTANVSVPVPNAGGYIDIGVGVNVNTPQAGCKDADIDDRGLLHFGQSYLQTPGGPTPSAYTGIGFYDPAGAATGAAPPAGAVHQFEGSVNAGGVTDVYFTGLLQLPPLPASATLVQAFTQPCPAGQMTIQPSAVECVTHANLGTGGTPRVVVPQHADTSAQIADVFVQWPGRGAVSASINGAQTVQLFTSLAGPHLSTLTPPALGYDALAHTQTVSVAPALAIGLYGSLVHSDELLALVQDPTLGAALVVLTLDEATGSWSAAAPISLSQFTTAQQQAIGLFGAGGCFPAPIVACDPATVQAPIVRAPIRNSGLGPTATLTISLERANGDPVDAAHPLYTSSADPMTVHVQWSASGLTAGQYAYAAVGLCDPYGSIANSNSGQWIGPSCNNGVGAPQAHNAFAFDGVPADASGAVTENLQFKLSARNYLSTTADSSWTIPVTIYVGNDVNPDPADVVVADVGGLTGVTVPLKHLRTGMTQVDIRQARQVAAGAVTLQDGSVNATPGVVWNLLYRPSTGYNGAGQTSDFLEGTSVLTLLPPDFSSGLNPVLVQGSAQILFDGADARPQHQPGADHHHRGPAAPRRPRQQHRQPAGPVVAAQPAADRLVVHPLAHAGQHHLHHPGEHRLERAAPRLRGLRRVPLAQHARRQPDPARAALSVHLHAV
jgi:hypothetical protein